MYFVLSMSKTSRHVYWNRNTVDFDCCKISTGALGTQGNAETGSGAAAQEEEEGGDNEDDDEERHPSPEVLVREAADDVGSAGAGHCHIDHVCKTDYNEDNLGRLPLSSHVWTKYQTTANNV